MCKKWRQIAYDTRLWKHVSLRPEISGLHVNSLDNLLHLIRYLYFLNITLASNESASEVQARINVLLFAKIQSINVIIIHTTDHTDSCNIETICSDTKHAFRSFAEVHRATDRIDHPHGSSRIGQQMSKFDAHAARLFHRHAAARFLGNASLPD